MSGERCWRIGCQATAVWRAHLILRPASAAGAKPDAHKDARGDMLIALCDAHRNEEPTCRDIIPADGWTKIVEAFENAGAAVPDIDASVVGFDPIQ